ncbi:hypothetical protein BH24ACT5_BH24ACT5_02020 [soil metagenome]
MAEPIDGGWELRVGETSVTIEPELGGRISSVRLGGREWLHQPTSPRRPARPFDPFVRPDLAGWDEMVPTCVPVRFDGVDLPDHGEVWARSWAAVERPDGGSDLRDSLGLEVACDSTTIRVRRVARLGPDRLDLDYELTNEGSVVSAAFWMAHPLFDATDLVDVALSPTPISVVRTYSDSDEPDASPRYLPREIPDGGFRKYRIGGGDAVRAVRLMASDGTELTMTWRAPVPIFTQIWVDSGAVGTGPVVAPEPAIAWGDDPVSARTAGALPLLAPGETLAFSLRVSARAPSVRF